jgi:hypothetical protein
VGHFFKSVNNTLNSSLKLDEEGTSGEGSNKVDSILTSGNTGGMLSIEFRPGGVFTISLSLTGIESVLDRSEFSNGLSELIFGIS